jgi:hypothetical protein
VQRDCFASLAMTADVVIERQMLSLPGARSATKQSPPRGWARRPKGNAAFWRNEPEAFGGRTVFWRNEPEILNSFNGRWPTRRNDRRHRTAMWFFHVKFEQALSKSDEIKARHTGKTSIALRHLEDMI